jgi:hypothetical protein
MENIEVLRSTGLVAPEGGPGKFVATLRRKPTEEDKQRSLQGTLARIAMAIGKLKATTVRTAPSTRIESYCFGKSGRIVTQGQLERQINA